MDWFTSVSDAVKTTTSLGIGLPTLQSGHIELPITRIYPCPVRWDDEVRRPRAFLVHVRRRTVDRSREEEDDDPATRAQLVFALTFP